MKKTSARPSVRALVALTAHDISFWGPYDMVTLVLSLFIVGEISGGSAGVAGVALFLYKFSSMATSIPLGWLLDLLPGLNDEKVGLLFSSLLTGYGYLALGLSSTVTHVIGIMVLLGLARSLNLNTWRKLFNRSLDSRHLAKQFAAYDTVFSLGTSLMAVVAGFVSDQLGVRVVIVVAGIVVMFGGTLPIFLKKGVLVDNGS